MSNGQINLLIIITGEQRCYLICYVDMTNQMTMLGFEMLCCKSYKSSNKKSHLIDLCLNSNLHNRKNIMFTLTVVDQD